MVSGIPSTVDSRFSERPWRRKNRRKIECKIKEFTISWGSIRFSENRERSENMVLIIESQLHVRTQEGMQGAGREGRLGLHLLHINTIKRVMSASLRLFVSHDKKEPVSAYR